MSVKQKLYLDKFTNGWDCVNAYDKLLKTWISHPERYSDKQLTKNNVKLVQELNAVDFELYYVRRVLILLQMALVRLIHTDFKDYSEELWSSFILLKRLYSSMKQQSCLIDCIKKTCKTFSICSADIPKAINSSIKRIRERCLRIMSINLPSILEPTPIYSIILNSGRKDWYLNVLPNNDALSDSDWYKLLENLLEYVRQNPYDFCEALSRQEMRLQKREAAKVKEKEINHLDKMRKLSEQYAYKIDNRAKELRDKFELGVGVGSPTTLYSKAVHMSLDYKENCYLLLVAPFTSTLCKGTVNYVTDIEGNYTTQVTKCHVFTCNDDLNAAIDAYCSKDPIGLYRVIRIK